MGQPVAHAALSDRNIALAATSQTGTDRPCAVEQVFACGVPLRDDLVLELARLVDDPELADRLEDAPGGW